MLPGLAPASCAISRIETALKPLVENSTSAALRLASRIFEFRVIGFDSVFQLHECTKELVLSTRKRRTMLRAAAILAVFALKKNSEFGWKPPVHILDINAVSVGTTLQPAGLEASKAVDQRQLQRGPARSELAVRPPGRRIFRFMPKYYADGDKACDRASLVTSKLAHDRQVQICKKRRIRRPNQRNVVLSWQAFPSTDNFSRSMLVASAVAADGRESKRCWPGSCFDRVVL